MMHAERIPFLCSSLALLGYSALCFPSSAYAQGQQRSGDSLFIIPHERYFERHALQTPPVKSSPRERSLIPSGDPFPNLNISGDTTPQNEPSVRISHTNPNVAIAAWRDFRTGVNPAIRRIGYSTTTDGGQTWSPSALLPQLVDQAGYHRMSDPAVCVDRGGHFYIATIAVDDNDNRGKILVYRQDEVYYFGLSFFAPLDTATNFFDDKEYITCDLSPISPFSNTLYISWTGFRGSGGGMLLTRSNDQGETWTHSVLINDPGNMGQGSDPCVRVNGDVCVVWAAGSGILFDKSTNGGVSFGTDKLISAAPGSGAGTGGFPSIATDLSGSIRSGNLYVTWSDNRNSDFDVFFSSSSDGGSIWSPPQRVNDDPMSNGKDQFWPWIAVDDRGVISIVYYDTRLTGNNSITYTFLAHSWDGGATFTNRLISTAPSPRNTPNGAVRYGDYIGLDSWGGHTISVWTDERAGGYDMDIYTAVMDTLPRANIAIIQFPVRYGWNMVSVPVSGVSGVTPYLFPTATLPAFAYNGGNAGSYVQSNSLVPGNGYWLRFSADQTVQITGDSIKLDTIPVEEGWNLIGALSSPIPASSITSDPPGLITSSFFAYGGTYTDTDSLFPGRGYWVNVAGSGRLFLSSTAGAFPDSRIHIVATNDLPPPSPENGETGHVTSNRPQRFSLGQNYPNPFNPSTAIRYEIAERANVSLKVYDMLGDEVATLVSGMREPGEYQTSWDAAVHSSGVYTYRLQVAPSGDGIAATTAPFLAVRKMLLVK